MVVVVAPRQTDRQTQRAPLLLSGTILRRRHDLTWAGLLFGTRVMCEGTREETTRHTIWMYNVSLERRPL